MYVILHSDLYGTGLPLSVGRRIPCERYAAAAKSHSDQGTGAAMAMRTTRGGGLPATRREGIVATREALRAGASRAFAPSSSLSGHRVFSQTEEVATPRVVRGMVDSRCSDRIIATKRPSLTTSIVCISRLMLY